MSDQFFLLYFQSLPFAILKPKNRKADRGRGQNALMAPSSSSSWALLLL